MKKKKKQPKKYPEKNMVGDIEYLTKQERDDRAWENEKSGY